MRHRTGFYFFSFIFILIPALLYAQSPAERNNINRLRRTLNERAIAFEERSLLADYGGFG